MKSFIKKFIPHKWKIIYGKYKTKYQKYRLKLNIIRYLKKDSEYDVSEKKEIIDFLKHNPFSVFPYNFTKKYKSENITVYTDSENSMKYVLHENKRLYFKRKWNESEIKNYYSILLLEQDADSPHRYETPYFNVQEGDTVVDAGVAEGNFALSIVEKAQKLYLFEVDNEWIEALNLTFAPWKEKVEIVNKYVSDNDNNGNVTLDTFFQSKRVNFIKADIEGAEMSLLRGSKNIISSNNSIRMILCTYHKHNDAEDINKMLVDSGFKTEFSKGYMIFVYDKALSEPYLRKGLIRAAKKQLSKTK
jgi:predicted RNA methylase